MQAEIKQRTGLFFGINACISALVFVSVEMGGGNSQPVILYVFVFSALIVYHLRRLLEYGGSKVVQTFMLSAKGIASVCCLGFFLVLCSTPINEITQYLSHSRHPFRQYHWLMSSLAGIYFSLSFLNYTLSSPDGLWVKIALVGRKIWTLPAKYFLLIFSIWVFAIANLFSYAAFEHIPHVQDEIAQLFQAKIFAQGSVTAPLPPRIDFFHYFLDNMIFTNRWYSQYPFGHPLCLLFGVLFGIPWIINPLLASASAILLYQCAVAYYGEREARLAVVLFSVSPFVLFMSASFMNHVSTLFFLLVFLYGAQKSIAGKSSLHAFLSGAALGSMLNIRVGDAFAIGLVFGTAFFIWSMIKHAYRPFLWFVLAVLVMTAALFAYNYLTNGDPFLFGYQVRWGNEHTIGFYNKSMLDNKPVFTPLRAIIHTLSNFTALNENLFEWPVPSLLPLAIFWMPFVFKKNKEYLLLCGLLTMPAFYFFYFFQDLCLGPRFLYSSLPFVLLLTVRAIFSIIKGSASLCRCSETQVENAFIALLVLSVISCGCLRVPRLYRFYADSFWGVDNEMMKKVCETGIKNAVIFQTSCGYKGDDLGSGFLHNSPRLDGPIVFARDLSERNAELIPFFPGRRYYRAFRDKQGALQIQPLRLQPAAGVRDGSRG
jgi:hypothetical protein